MNKKNIHVMIMAGGIGSRFWPLSTPKKPKQFVDILGLGKSLLQLTFERMLSIVDASNIWVLTNEDYRNEIAAQLPSLDLNQILFEPERKNTAPCIAYATAKCSNLNPDATIIIVPSDHIILNLERFKDSISKAILTSENGDIVTLGIKPTRPDTGYGYIELEKKETTNDIRAKSVLRFCEKPTQEKALGFLKEGNFLWNAGIFIAKVKTLKEAFQRYAPVIYNAFFKNNDWLNSDEEFNFVGKAFLNVPNISIDFAIMEQAQNVKVIPSDFDWSDLGTWGSLVQLASKDDMGNSVVSGQAYLKDVRNCLVHVSAGNQILINGVQDLIIGAFDGKIFIAHKEKEPDFKEDFDQLLKDNDTSPV